MYILCIYMYLHTSLPFPVLCHLLFCHLSPCPQVSGRTETVAGHLQEVLPVLCSAWVSARTHTHTHTTLNGLLYDCISVFLSSCSIALGRRNFTLQYDTNIPRQVVRLDASMYIHILYIILCKCTCIIYILLYTCLEIHMYMYMHVYTFIYMFVLTKI